MQGELFNHREIPVIICAICGHVQTRLQPPPGYPDYEFAQVYPKLSAEQYADRKKRIYTPKLEWILNSLADKGYKHETLAKMQWTEIGAGAGYFLSALEDARLSNIVGFDADKTLVDIANTFTAARSTHFGGEISDAIDRYPADIYVAFFVLEHIQNAHLFYQKLRSLPQGTIFIFAVPIFGFSCLLENVFTDNFARNFDGVLHTQLYTEQSIDHAMKTAGFEITAKWIFGQDATDLTRLLINNINTKVSQDLLRHMEKDLISIQDSLQNCLDKAGLADQRHILAIKR